MYTLGAKSLSKLEGVDSKLVSVVKRAIEISAMDFSVIEGLRTVERQKELVASGASKTMKSYHLRGEAVDLAPFVDGKISWDWKHFPPVADAMKKAASELNVKITWGGDWKSFKDGPHFQIEKE